MSALLCKIVLCVFSLLLSMAVSAQVNAAEPTSPITTHNADTNTIVELNDNDRIDLKPYLRYWLPDHPIDFATASDADNQHYFQAVTSIRAPVSGRDIWYRFQVKPSAKWSYRAILDFNDILFEDLELFVQTPQGISRSIAGLNHPYAERPLANRYIAMPLAVPGDVVSTVYYRVRTLTGIQTSINPTLLNDVRFYEDSSIAAQIVATVNGGMVVVLIFMTIVANLILKGRVLFVFLAFAFAVLILNLLHTGIVAQWIDLQTNTLRFLFIMLPGLMNILSFYYCRYLFDMPNNMPRLNTIITPVSVVYVLILLMFTALPTVWLSTNILTIKAAASAIVSLVVMAFGLHALQLKIKGSGYYLLGLLLYVGLVNVTRLPAFGLAIYTVDSRSFVSLGALALMLCFAIATLQKLRQITEREKHLEKNAAVLENQNRVRTDFLISMSHEIRTPINGVLGMAQMLEKTRLDNGQRYYLDILSSAGRTLLNVVNEILDISKLEAGKLEVESIYFNLDQTINYTAELFGQINRKAGVHFHYESDFTLPVHVMGDPARLQQILNNLLSNAFKFTEKGEVSLAVKLIDRISEDRVLLRIEVKDSGIGISEEALSRLFNPFQQADSTTSRRYGGTGLGLAICKKIVELMGGHIHAVSSANEGSRFWADIPFNIAQREETRYLNTAHSIEGKHIAMVLRFPEYNKIYISALDYWHAETAIVNPDTAPDSLDWPHIDVMYISDMLPMPLLLSWIETAKKRHCPIVLANGYGENYRPSDIPESASLRRLQQPMSKARLADLLHQIFHNISPTAAESGNGISNHNVTALHLLVAEDNEVNTKVLQALFAKHSINAEFVVNGEQAVQCYCAEPNRFDAILMDCEMPILNGFEATTQIRQFELDNRHSPITIIALTAHALLETRDACMACGMNDILTKPVNFAALLSRLEQVAVTNYA